MRFHWNFFSFSGYRIQYIYRPVLDRITIRQKALQALDHQMMLTDHFPVMLDLSINGDILVGKRHDCLWVWRCVVCIDETVTLQRRPDAISHHTAALVALIPIKEIVEGAYMEAICSGPAGECKPLASHLFGDFYSLRFVHLLSTFVFAMFGFKHFLGCFVTKLYKKQSVKIFDLRGL
jgi:hypothetical protein